jgi:hypothetical protein
MCAWACSGRLAEDTLQFQKENLGLRLIGDFTDLEARVFASRSVLEHSQKKPRCLHVSSRLKMSGNRDSVKFIPYTQMAALLGAELKTRLGW